MSYGNGLGDIGGLYRNPIYYQKGSGLGLGSLFLGLSKYLIPILTKTGRALSKQAIKTSKGVIGDMAATAMGRSNKSVRQILSDQGSEAISELSDKVIRGLKRKLNTQSGSGRKRIKALTRVKKQTSVLPKLKRKRRVRKKQKKKKTKKPRRKTKSKKKKTTKRGKSSKKPNKKRILDIFT